MLMDQMPVQVVGGEVFAQCKDALLGLNANNVQEIDGQLAELGIGPAHHVHLQAPPPATAVAPP